MLASLRSHYGLLAVVTVFVLLATADNLLVPPFEGADEHRHYAYVRHLAQGRGLPIQVRRGSVLSDCSTQMRAEPVVPPTVSYAVSR